jgi:hypothetical protein
MKLVPVRALGQDRIKDDAHAAKMVMPFLQEPGTRKRASSSQPRNSVEAAEGPQYGVVVTVVGRQPSGSLGRINLRPPYLLVRGEQELFSSHVSVVPLLLSTRPQCKER